MFGLNNHNYWTTDRKHSFIKSSKGNGLRYKGRVTSPWFVEHVTRGVFRIQMIGCLEPKGRGPGAISWRSLGGSDLLLEHHERLRCRCKKIAQNTRDILRLNTKGGRESGRKWEGEGMGEHILHPFIEKWLIRFVLTGVHHQCTNPSFLHDQRVTKLTVVRQLDRV